MSAFADLERHVWDTPLPERRERRRAVEAPAHDGVADALEKVSGMIAESIAANRRTSEELAQIFGEAAAIMRDAADRIERAMAPGAPRDA